jgi:plastocyanin
VRLRRRYLPAMALLGAGIACLPALAASAVESSPTVGAQDKTGGGPHEYEWSPMEVTLGGSGGSVTFQNNTAGVPHGIVWDSGPETPSCEGVPVDSSSSSGWKGNCSFSKEGTYLFHCYVHGMSMSGKIVVGNLTTTSTTSTSTTSSTTSTSTSSRTSTTTSSTSTTTSSTSSGHETTTSSTSRPPEGSSTTGTQAGSSTSISAPAGQANAEEHPSQAPLVKLSLAGSQHGTSVRGSVTVAAAGAGGRLEVELLAKGASIAGEHAASQVRVGSLARSSVKAGKVFFTVGLDAAGRRALRRHHSLTLTVKVALTPVHGKAGVVRHSVVLHR